MTLSIQQMDLLCGYISRLHNALSAFRAGLVSPIMLLSESGT